METQAHTRSVTPRREPWNKGKLIGQKTSELQRQSRTGFALPQFYPRANCRLMHCSKRDPGYVTPPAQIRPCGSPAHCSDPPAPRGSTFAAATR
jgi:hypothetical protein